MSIGRDYLSENHVKKPLYRPLKSLFDFSPEFQVAAESRDGRIQEQEVEARMGDV